MDCIEQARLIYNLCVTKVCSSRSTMTYGEVLNALGYKKNVSGQAIRYGLELVLIACANLGLPKLTSIVVNKSSGSPSAGEYLENSWEKEAKNVFRNGEWPDVDKIDWEYVWKNRKELSNKYGTRDYWNNK